MHKHLLSLLFAVSMALPAHAATVSVSPMALSFGDAPVGGVAGPAQTFTISNTGDDPTEVLDVRLSSPSSSYTVDYGGCMVLLDPGMSCQVAVTFRPVATGSTMNRLDIELDDGSIVEGPSLSGTGAAGVATWSAAQVNFQSVAVGQWSAPQSVSLNNTGSGAMNVTKVEILGSSAFALDGHTCGGLAPGSSCTLSLKVLPPDAQIQTASLRLTFSGATVASSAIQLYAQPSVAPALSLSAADVDFGNVEVGQEATRTLTLTSTGNAPLTLTGLSLAGSDAGRFSLLNPDDCLATWAPGGSCTVQVQVRPQTNGPVYATLNIASNQAAPTTSVSLTAQGVSGKLEVAPAELNFDTVQRGAEKSLLATLRNTGLAPVSVQSISPLPGDKGFATSGCVGQTLAPGASCELSVRYAPVGDGEASVTFSIAHNGLPTPTTFRATGTGESAPPALSFSPPALDFGDTPAGGSRTLSVTLSASGGSALTLNNVQISGSGAGQFRIANPAACPSSLNPGGSCTLQIEVAPTGSGKLTAQLSMATNQPVSLAQVSLSANGVIGQVEASPAALAFGTLEVGASKTLSTVLTNTGQASITLGSLSLSGTTTGYSTAGCTGQTLAVGASCSLSVSFIPNLAGEAVATLSLTHNGQGGALAISLSGRGEAPLAATGTLSTARCASEAQTALAFSCEAVLSNPGKSPLTVTAATHSNPLFGPLSSDCPAQLARGQSCTLRLAPVFAQSGTYSTELAVSTGAGTLVATAIAVVRGPVLAWTAQGHGSVEAGQSRSATHSLSNAGPVPVSLTGSLELTGHQAANFGINAATCPAVLAPGARCTVTTQCQPLQAGALTARLVAGVSPAQAAVVLTCTGLPAAEPMAASEQITGTGSAEYPLGRGAPLSRSAILAALHAGAEVGTLRGIHETLGTDQAYGASTIEATCAARPRVRSFDLGYALASTSPADDLTRRPAQLAKMVEAGLQGDVIALSWHQCNPTMGEPCGWSPGVHNTPLTAAQWTQLFTEGSALNRAMRRQVQPLIDTLRVLQSNGVSVVLRPFHGSNVPGLWWHSQNPDLPRYAYYWLRLQLEAANLTNVVYAWSATHHEGYAGNWADYYPGDAYVDVIGADAFPDSLTGLGPDYMQIAQALATLAPNKPRVLSAFSKAPTEAALQAGGWAYAVAWGIGNLTRDTSPAAACAFFQAGSSR